MSTEDKLKNELNAKSASPKTKRRARRTSLIAAGIGFILLGLTLIFGSGYFFSHPYWGNKHDGENIRQIPATAFGQREIQRASNFKRNKPEKTASEKTRGFAEGSAAQFAAFSFAANKSGAAQPTATPAPNESSNGEGKRNFFEKIYEWFVGLFKKKKKPPANVTALALDKESVTIACPTGTNPQAESCSDDASIKLTATAADDENAPLTFIYTVTGGRIIGQGASVVWDLTGVSPATYAVTVGANNGSGVRGKTVTRTVTVRNCDCGQNCSCPTLDVIGPAAPVRLNETMIFTANVSGGSQNVVGYRWSVSQGEIVSGQGTPVIGVSTRGFVTTTIEATVNMSGVECAGCITSASASGTIAFTARTRRGGGWSIRGRISDANGIPITNAIITVINSTTGQVVGDAETDGNGSYRVSGLKSDIYTVTVSAANFRAAETQVEIGVGLPSTVNITLPSGIPPTPRPTALPVNNNSSTANVSFDTNFNVNANTNINTNINANANTSVNTNANYSNTSVNTGVNKSNVSTVNNSNIFTNTNSGKKPTRDKVEYSYPKRLIENTPQKVTLNLQPAKPDDVTTVNTSGNYSTNGIVVLSIPVPQEQDYITYVTATLIADDGLEILSANGVPQEYTRSNAPEDLTKWEWDVKLNEGGAKKDNLQIRYKLDVELKKAGASSKIINDFWVSDEFNIGIGLLLFHALGGLFVASGGLATAAGARGKGETTADEVHCTLYAPAEAKAGGDFLVQIFAHLPAQAAGLKAIAEASDEKTKQQAARVLDKPIERGSRLTFELRMPPAFVVDEPVQAHLWNGSVVEIPFIVSVPKTYESSSKFGKIIVSENDVPIGRLTFKIEILGAESAQKVQAEKTSVEELERYRCAFISYSSRDRAKVAPRVQALEAAHIECFQDVLSLRPGENWAEKLYGFIDRSDAFFLFWSSASRDSAEVEKEILYAMERQQKTAGESPDIIPIIIEGPPPVPPPEELNFLHFNDRHVYFNYAVEAENETKKQAGQNQANRNLNLKEK